MSRNEEKQFLREQIRQARAHLEKLEGQLEELEAMRIAVSEFSKEEKNSKILFPVVSGVFAEARVEKPESFKVNVGKGVFIDKKPEEVEIIINHQKKELLKYKEELEREIENLTSIARQAER